MSLSDSICIDFGSHLCTAMHCTFTSTFYGLGSEAAVACHCYDINLWLSWAQMQLHCQNTRGKSNDRQRGRGNPPLEVSQSRSIKELAVYRTVPLRKKKIKLLTTSPLLSAQLLDLQLPQMSAERPQENSRNRTMHMYCCNRTLL